MLDNWFKKALDGYILISNICVTMNLRQDLYSREYLTNSRLTQS